MPDIHIFQAVKKKLAGKHGRPNPSLLSLPPEIRLKIYEFLAPKFLPEVPDNDYRGLYLSCKTIKNELDYECYKAAPAAVAALGVHPININPAWLSMSRRMCIEMPRSCLSFDAIQIALFENLRPLMALYLNEITFLLQDNQHENWVNDTIAANSGEEYAVRTMYSDVIPFATHISCLVAPQMCRKSDHSLFNFHCMRQHLPFVRGQSTIENYPVNVKRVRLELKKLHPETNFTPFVYPWGVPQFQGDIRFSPAIEKYAMRRKGWKVTAEGLAFYGDALSMPTGFVWKMKKMKRGRGALYRLHGRVMDWIVTGH